MEVTKVLIFLVIYCIKEQYSSVRNKSKFLSSNNRQISVWLLTSKIKQLEQKHDVTPTVLISAVGRLLK